jgi:hypothetical protein
VEDVDLPISGAEVGVVARALGWLARRRKDPVAVLKQREAVRNEIRQHLASDESKYPEVVVVRLRHEDAYPNADLRLLPFGASPWFKFEVKGAHDRALEVVLAIEYAVIKRGRATLADDETPGAVKVFVVGRIPYNRIKHMDWSPDSAYGLPRLYTAYSWRGPCQEIVLYDAPSKPNGYLYEIPDVKWKGEPSRRKRLRRKLLRVQMAREDRRNMRKLRDGDFVL